jgi:HD-GYP domain-containing protein (c-di-GMP phosphodiesterase class II)
MGILEVWIRHRDLEFLEEIIDEELGDRQRDVYMQVRRSFEAVMQGGAAEVDVAHFERSVGDLFHFLKSSAQSDVLLQKLDAFDNYLMSHSANMCYLALLLGMKLERYLIDQRRLKSARDAKSLVQLGLGCLLHDVGKMRVPREILNKPGRLDRDELDEMRRHTEHGYRMVRGRLPAPAAQIVLNHHQRFNGEGYPGRLDHQTGEALSPPAGRQIPIFSRIAIVADVYDAATSRRCYSAAKLPVRVLHEMRTQCRGFFDPVVEAAFYQVVPPFAIGQTVTLSDGVEAVVVDFNPEFPARPKVQCLKTPDGRRFEHPSLEEIDLALYSDLEIVSADGQDVRPYTASQQEAPALA